MYAQFGHHAQRVNNLDGYAQVGHYSAANMIRKNLFIIRITCRHASQADGYRGLLEPRGTDHTEL